MASHEPPEMIAAWAKALGRPLTEEEATQLSRHEAARLDPRWDEGIPLRVQEMTQDAVRRRLIRKLLAAGQALEEVVELTQAPALHGDARCFDVAGRYLVVTGGGEVSPAFSSLQDAQAWARTTAVTPP